MVGTQLPWCRHFITGCLPVERFLCVDRDPPVRPSFLSEVGLHPPLGGNVKRPSSFLVLLACVSTASLCTFTFDCISAPVTCAATIGILLYAWSRIALASKLIG